MYHIVNISIYIYIYISTLHILLLGVHHYSTFIHCIKLFNSIWSMKIYDWDFFLQIDDCRRTHNYDQFICTFLSMLAKEGHLADLVEKHSLIKKRHTGLGAGRVSNIKTAAERRRVRTNRRRWQEKQRFHWPGKMKVSFWQESHGFPFVRRNKDSHWTGELCEDIHWSDKNKVFHWTGETKISIGQEKQRFLLDKKCTSVNHLFQRNETQSKLYPCALSLHWKQQIFIVVKM